MNMSQKFLKHLLEKENAWDTSWDPDGNSNFNRATVRMYALMVLNGQMSEEDAMKALGE